MAQPAHLPFLALLLLTIPATAQTCTANATSSAANRTLALQSKLLAASSPEMDTDVPQALKPVLHDFKQALITTIETALRCNNPEPNQVQGGLVRLLHANQPEKPFVYQPPRQGPDPPDIGDYGGELDITVKPVPKQPGLFSVDLTYAIECGTDTILLLYRHTAQGWQRELIYANPDLNSVGDALGDFFTWSLVPGPYGSTLFAAAHGKPWCSSRFSGFGVDLLALAEVEHSQKMLAHIEGDYSRGDHDPVIARTADGFQFRVDATSRDLDIFTEPRIWRFLTTAGHLDRTQPIALNARDFVDAWLDLPWTQAAAWSDPPTPSLHAFLDRFDYNKHSLDDVLSLAFGPVRACGADRFQVELDLTDGPKSDQPSIVYALVHRSPTAFTMLSAIPQPDPACTGPDIMKKPHH